MILHADKTPQSRAASFADAFREALKKGQVTNDSAFEFLSKAKPAVKKGTAKMNLREMSDESLALKLNALEAMICREPDYKKLPPLSAMFQRLLDEQVRRDLENE